MNFFQGMFSSDSSASYGRFASFLSLTCLLIWVSLIISKGGTIPEIPESWVLIVCTPFGITKIGEIMSAKKASDTPTV